MSGPGKVGESQRMRRICVIDGSRLMARLYIKIFCSRSRVKGHAWNTCA